MSHDCKEPRQQRAFRIKRVARIVQGNEALLHAVFNKMDAAKTRHQVALDDHTQFLQQHLVVLRDAGLRFAEPGGPACLLVLAVGRRGRFLRRVRPIFHHYLTRRTVIRATGLRQS